MKLLVETKKRRINGEIFRFGIFKCPLCYNFTEVRLHNGKRNKSCGCIHFKHRLSRKNGKHVPLYRIWRGMKYRCLCKTAHNYHRYGARGIKICDEWENDFEKFYHWAKKNGYYEGLSIDRIDNDGNYEPENCQFLTCSENSKKDSTKISEEESKEIRSLYNKNIYNQDELANIYNVSSQLISLIICNNTQRDDHYVRKVYRTRAGTPCNKKINQ